MIEKHIIMMISGCFEINQLIPNPPKQWVIFHLAQISLK